MITILVNDDNITDLEYVPYRTNATFTANEDAIAEDIVNMLRIAMLTDTYVETTIYKGMVDNVVKYMGIKWIKDYLSTEYQNEYNEVFNNEDRKLEGV